MPALSEVDGRTALQWLVAAQEHCLCNSGVAWRKRHQRDWMYWYYLDGWRTLQDAKYADPDAKRILPALPVLNPAPTPTPAQREYAKWTRGELVAALMAENPALNTSTSKKILSHLATAKLARKLDETRRENAEFMRARA